MCAGAIIQARIPTVVYGATDPKAGACHTLYQITNDARLNHRAIVSGCDVMQDECRGILAGILRPAAIGWERNDRKSLGNPVAQPVICGRLRVRRTRKEQGELGLMSHLTDP